MLKVTCDEDEVSDQDVDKNIELDTNIFMLKAVFVKYEDIYSTIEKF